MSLPPHNKKIHSFLKNTKTETEEAEKQEQKAAAADPKHHYSNLNQYIDIGFVCMNALTSLILTVGPWFKVYEDTPFPDAKCVLVRGTIVNPGISGLCELQGFYDIPIDGSTWKSLMGMVYFYLGLSLILLAIVIVFLLKQNRKFVKHDNSQTVSFAVNLVTFIIICIILGQFGSVKKPVKNDLGALGLLWLSFGLTLLRLANLGYMMYNTRKSGHGTGIFKTGADIYDGPVQVHYFN